MQAAGPEQDPVKDREVAELFAELGTLVVLDDALVDVAMGLMSCGPAYVALVAEAQVDAGVRRGIPAAQGADLVIQTLAGTAELLRRRGNDTVAVRREVSSPGGLTARGVDALERAGLQPPSATPWMPCSRSASGPRDGQYGDRRASSRRSIYVYTILIVMHIVIQLLFAAGLRPPYNRATDSVLQFLRDICEPFLQLFRRLHPELRRARFQPAAGPDHPADRQPGHRRRPDPRLSPMGPAADRKGPGQPRFAWLVAGIVLVVVVGARPAHQAGHPQLDHPR